MIVIEKGAEERVRKRGRVRESNGNEKKREEEGKKRKKKSREN